MSGERIRVVENIFAKFTKMCESNADIEIKTGVLSFNTKSEWVNESKWILEDALNFENLQLKTEGMTNVGVAQQELNIKLSTEGFFKDSSIHRRPLIIFILDGYSTDDNKRALEELRRNKWFKISVKLGLAIGSETDTELLDAVVGEEGTFTSEDLFVEILNKLLNPINATNLHICIDPVSDSVDYNTAKIKAVTGKNILLPSIETEQIETNMVIEINHIEHQMEAGEYRIVRCQLQTCDLEVANQECLVANMLYEKKLVRLTNIDPVSNTLYMMRFNLKKGQSLELETELFDDMGISGNVQLSMKGIGMCNILGISEDSVVAVFLDQGKHIDLQIGKKYEIETVSSKVSLLFSDDWTWGDDWDQAIFKTSVSKHTHCKRKESNGIFRL